MRKLVPVAVVASALLLSACGAGVKQSLNSALNSLGASPSVQLHFTATVSGAGTAEASAVLSKLSMDVDLTNPSGNPLSVAGKNADEEILVNVGTSTALDVREVGGNLYLLVDLTGLSSIPGINLSSSELASAQLLLGGRWFELPQSLLDSVHKVTPAEKAEVAKDTVIEGEVMTTIAHLIEKTHYTTLSNGGYRETGTLQSVEAAFLPLINSITGTTQKATPVKGSYALTLTLSGTTATGGSISITAPNPPSGNATVGLAVTVAHATETISAPTTATVISPSMIKSLEAGSL